MLKQTHFKQINYQNGTIEEEIVDEKSEYSSFYPSVNLGYRLEIPVN